jgi:hypothetical protein
MTEKLERYLLPAIVILTLAVFSPVAWHDFISFDDDVFVYENPNIRAGLTFEAIRWAFTTAHEVNWIPLTWMSHMLDVQLFGLNAGGHHLVNLLLHAASSGLLFVFLKRVTGASWRSAAVAMLFAVHPLHVESVAWVAERKDVLSAFFGMLTLLSYAWYSEKPGAGRYLTTLLLFLLGLLSKPMLVTLPVVLLLLDYWPLGRMPAVAEWRRAGLRSGTIRLFVEKVPFFALSACSSVITYLVQQTGGQLPQGYTLMSRAGKACIAYVNYLYKMVWPVDLAILYPFPKYQPSSAKMLVCAVILLAISAAVLWLRQRSPYLVTGWCWYFVTLLPVIGLIQIGQHSIADRYTYMPLIGIFIMVAWGAPQILARWPSRGIMLGGISAAVLATMIVLTSLQLRRWLNGFTIFSHTVAVTKDNWVAQNSLGLIYLQSGKTDEAIRLFKESIDSKPSYALAHLNLGAAYLITGEYDKAIESFRWSIRFGGANPKAHNGLGLAYLKLGKRELALSEYRILDESGSPYAADLLEMINKHSLR